MSAPLLPRPARRQLLRGTAALATAWSWPGLANAQATTNRPSPWRLLQLMDPAADQQEHVRDYAAGLQTALKAGRSNGGPELVVQSLSCDGSAAAVRGVAQRFQDDPALLALVGTTTERCSQACLTHWPAGSAPVPHIAPWLFDAGHDQAGHLLSLFASREQQLRQTLQTLEGMGLRRFGLVYDSAATQALMDPSIGAALRLLQLEAPRWTAATPAALDSLATQLPADAPPVLAFVGGTLELARFMAALAHRPVSRLVVSLSDIDVGLLQQLGAHRQVPLLLTQVVPNPGRQSLPLVRRFRDQYARTFDDMPSPSALAGYIAGRYLQTLLARLPANATRRTLLDEVRRRPNADLDGYTLQFSTESNRGSRMVVQTLLARDGKLLG